ncbi:MAG: SPOR domain-containing protein, partial [Rhodobacteraceae bacterium]|nr:SPOR domain-containing protein [Paracoccaceae bacterium]
IFSVEQNAENARNQMRQAGLSAEIRRGRVGENQFWRVVVGPAATTGERAQMLQRVRSLGFADAYAVQR